MNILIIEDEIPSYIKMKNYLANCLGDSFQHLHTRSVQASIKALGGGNSIDLVFSDIKLLDGIAFEIFEKISCATPFVFCTAYDDYLLKAFKANGIEYIIKPFSQADVESAIQKYETLLSSNKMNSRFLSEIKKVVTQENKRHKKRFAIKKQDGILLVESCKISCIEAFGELSKLIDSDGNLYISSSSIGKIALDLNPDQFFRINRSHIINIDHIEEIMHGSRNRLSILMKGRKNLVQTSSATTKHFRKWLEL